MCRQLMLSRAALLLLVVFVGVLPKEIHSNPIHGGLIDVPGTNDGPQCVNFTNHYCNEFENRTTAYFPNPRGHKTLEEAEKEFSHFIPLLQSGCHAKLGTLLCFIYFPFCENAYPSVRVYPCKEVCEEVTKPDCRCTNLIHQYGADWNDQLQCNMPHFKPKSSLQCADGVAPPYPGSPHMPTNSSCANSTDSEEPITTSTEAPTETEPDECGSDACPTECDYRENANSRTFKRNSYCYAARVTVKSYKVHGCQHSYTVEVKNQYDLQTPFNSTHSTKAPSMGDSAVILTSPSHCTKCPKLEVSKTYLISGPYSRAADGTVQWKLGDSKDQALVSEWVSKYDKKLGSFISSGNTDRESNSRFMQQCEKDTQMISAEQWIHH